LPTVFNFIFFEPQANSVYVVVASELISENHTFLHYQAKILNLVNCVLNVS